MGPQRLVFPIQAPGASSNKITPADPRFRFLLIIDQQSRAAELFVRQWLPGKREEIRVQRPEAATGFSSACHTRPSGCAGKADSASYYMLELGDAAGEAALGVFDGCGRHTQLPGDGRAVGDAGA